jgi:hypothetical protein
MFHRSHVRMTGPVAPYQDILWTDLLARGYTRLSAKNLLRLAAHLSRWLEARGLLPEHLTRDRIDAFVRHRRAQGYTGWRSPKGLEPILATLRAQKVVPPAEPVPREATPIAELLRGYERYLWLGHESIETTQVYLDADLASREAAVSRLEPVQNGYRRYRPTDDLLAFLSGL